MSDWKFSVEKEKSRNPTRSEEWQFGSTGLPQGFKTKIQIPKYRGKKHKTVSKFSYKLGFRRQTAKILAGSSGDDRSALRFSKQWNNPPTCQNNFLTCQNNFPTCQNNFPTSVPCESGFWTVEKLKVKKKCHSLFSRSASEKKYWKSVHNRCVRLIYTLW